MMTSIFKRPEKFFLFQTIMLRVTYSLIPVVLTAVYFFGWRSFFLVLFSLFFGILTEALFNLKNNKPVTSAVFVTSLIFALSLPPNLPFWMAGIGIIFGVAVGKMVFGGFGKNVFNPAMVGRCFIYVSFPIEMTANWSSPFIDGLGGFVHWATPVDAVTRATPLTILKNGGSLSLPQLFWGQIPGSLGEASAALIILCGIYLFYKKAASWRLAGACLTGGFFTSIFLHYGVSLASVPPISMLLSGSFLFGTVFVVTEPISGAKSKPGQWAYGLMVGAMTMILRAFSNFPEGFMFSILIMNAFVPIIDDTVGKLTASKRRTP